MATVEDPQRAQTPRLRLAEILAPLSLVTDLGMGAPDEQAMRACLLATALARKMGLSEPEVAHVYYSTLLQHLGCTATSREEASHLGGDQLATRPLISHADMMRPAEMLSLLRRIGSDRPPLARLRMVLGTLDGIRWGAGVQAGICEVAAHLAARLGMPDPVQQALGQMFERWDGKDGPQRLAGEAIAAPARFAQLSSRAIALAELGGPEAAVEGVRRSSGGWLDPSIAAVFAERGADMLAEIAETDALTATLAAEPQPWLRVHTAGLDATIRAFADMVDLQSPYTLGHSPGVAALAHAAGSRLGLDESECELLLRAALLHDLGRVGVPAGAWDKPGPLNAVEWERVRLHPYYTERILARSPALAGEAAVAGRHHERMDGSGYHRGVGGREQSLPVRILAASDAYQTMTERRPHRDARTREQAADRLAEEARDGRLDPEVVEALLAASGEPRRIPRETPANLSEREIEVLRLIATGRSNSEIADHLVISRRTAEHHVQHIYAKIGVSTRPGATLFALEHGLVTP